jgi:hypothetical protein
MASDKQMMIDFTNLLQYFAITVVFLVITVVLASFGNIYGTIFHYFGDFAFFILFLYLGYRLTTQICLLSQHGRKVQAWLWSALYFFMAFVVFSDGHGTVEHSADLWEKLQLIPVTAFLFFKSIFLPLIFLGIALIHNALMYLICQPCRQDLY